MTQMLPWSEIDDRVRTIVSDELELDKGELTGFADFADDYGADSLSLITVLSRFEKELRIKIPADELPGLTSLDGVLASVRKHAPRAAGD